MEISNLKKELTSYAEKLNADELTTLLDHAKTLLKKHSEGSYTNMSEQETAHLEEEFGDYKKKYPIE